MKCPCTKDCPHRTCNCRSVCCEFKEYDRQRMEAMRSEIASGRRRRPCPRLATHDLTGTHDTTRKERFNMLLLAIIVSAGVAWLLLKWLEAIEYDED